MYASAWAQIARFCMGMGVIVAFLFQAIGRFGIFRRAGIPGWKGLIPLYSTYVQYSLTWSTTWFWVLVFAWGGRCLTLMVLYLFCFDPEMWIVSMVLPDLACIAFGFGIRLFAMRHLSQAFGRGRGFAWGLFLLEPIFLLILDSDKYPYPGNHALPEDPR